jgi:prophage antirepressor-like protein
MTDLAEDIKIDNNCIVKAFENNPIAILQEKINNKKIYCFKASDIGKALQLANIAVSIQHYDDDEKVLRKAYDLRGCEQDTTFLTSQGVYRLLYNSKKEIAKKFRKWAGNILDDIIFNESIELKKQIEQKDKLILQIQDERFNELKMEKHKVLLKMLNDKNCVYLIEISKDLIKIGSSHNIDKRKDSIQKIFGGQGIFLDVFECNSYRNVERNILNDITIQEHKYKDKLETGHTSNEVVLLSQDFTYEQLVEIVKQHVNKYDFLTPSQLLEKQKLDLIELLTKNGESLCNITKVFETPLIIEQKVLNEQLPTSSVITQQNLFTETVRLHPVYNVNTLKPNNGKSIQKIDPNNLTRIVQLYKNMETLMEHNKYDCFSETGIRDAIKNNRIYKRYRWMFVDNDKDPMVIHNIQPTVQSKKAGCNIILELNKQKTMITNHYMSLNVSQQTLQMSVLQIKKLISNKTLYNDHYYIYLDDCTHELLQTYDNNLFKYVPKCAVKVKAINPETNEEIIFPSLSHAYKFCKVHHKTVRKAIDDKKILNGYYWKLA